MLNKLFMENILFVTLDEAVEIHRDQIERYGRRSGIRDLSLLQYYNMPWPCPGHLLRVCFSIQTCLQWQQLMPFTEERVRLLPEKSNFSRKRDCDGTGLKP
ncbi:hypothetical protein HY02_04595 [Peptococcaceae bacterium SCADC1_2_3]|nr:hypothetical protein DK28_0213865 [Peptococcaceae bacterium SCADC1_2_3]KFI34580.1 hypothetical protein HY02_04595 [Peptococcaceae bacterium SCADC1_2_3]KFI36147.1 hypothetical protein HY00_05845 [Peptococcaceae bacterium SCADC1_2_3]